VSDTFLSRNDQMEALSRAYVSAVAARAGYDATRTQEFDRDSVDLIVSAKGAMRPQIHMQLKATTRIAPRLDVFDFQLVLKNYDDLRIKTQNPRILVVLDLPRKESSWVNQSVQRLILRKCAYWKSLLGMPESPNATTVPVPIDKSQILDAPTLVELMQRSRTGMPL
jgi:hypothetical protein